MELTEEELDCDVCFSEKDSKISKTQAKLN